MTTSRELVSRRRAQWLSERGAIPRDVFWRSEQPWPDLPGAAPWAAAALEVYADAALPAS
jgi:hypothetical protein